MNPATPAPREDGREIDARVAQLVMRLDVRGFTYAYTVEGTWSVTNEKNGKFWEADGRGGLHPVYVIADHWLQTPVPNDETFNGVPLVGLAVVPFYSTDPAAAFAVEAEIERRGLDRLYARELANIVSERFGVNIIGGFDCVCFGDLFRLAHATPRQRCEAALRAVEEGGGAR